MNVHDFKDCTYNDDAATFYFYCDVNGTPDAQGGYAMIAPMNNYRTAPKIVERERVTF